MGEFVLKILRINGAILLLLPVSLVAPGVAHATNGFYLTGQGQKAATMGGASVANPQDAVAAANNPAGLAFLEDRVDVDVQYIIANNEATFGSPGNQIKGYNRLPVPEFGINYHLSPRVAVGLSTFGSGAGWHYRNPLLPDQGLGKMRTSFAQVGVLPTLAYRVTDSLALGVSLAVARQTINAVNIAFETPVGVFKQPNYGRRDAWGIGGRVGVQWSPNNLVSVGATYISKMKFSKFKDYGKDLLAEGKGRFDSPEQFGFGLALHLTPKLTVAGDYMHIDWRGVKALSDASGFGWRNQNIWRGGASVDLTDRTTVRAGASFADRHFNRDFLTANIVIPGVASKAVSAGITQKLGSRNEITLGGEYELGGRVNGTGPSAGSSVHTKYGYIIAGFGHRF